jgi:hypothetical protein
MVMRPSSKAYGVLVAVLLSGVVIGAGGSYVALRRPESAGVDRETSRHRERIEALGRELGLSGEQRAKIETILTSSRDERAKRMRAMYETCGEPVREHKKRIDDEIRANLSPAQQKRFDELAEEQEKRFFPKKEGETQP